MVLLEFDYGFAILLFMLLLVLMDLRRISNNFLGSDRARLRRLEERIESIQRHHGLNCDSAPNAPWQTAAEAPDGVIKAIKLYREGFGVGLKEAKEAVDAHRAGRAKSP